MKYHSNWGVALHSTLAGALASVKHVQICLDTAKPVHSRLALHASATAKYRTTGVVEDSGLPFETVYPVFGSTKAGAVRESALYDVHSTKYGTQTRHFYEAVMRRLRVMSARRGSSGEERKRVQREVVCTSRVSKVRFTREERLEFRRAVKSAMVTEKR